MHAKKCPGKSEADKILPSLKDILFWFNQGRLVSGAHCKECKVFACPERPTAYFGYIPKGDL